MSHFGIKVGKPGRNPSSADPRDNPTDTSQKDLIFNSDLLTFKYVKAGVLKIKDIGTTYTVSHGLNYPPSFQLFSRNQTTGEIKLVIYDAGTAGPAVVPWVDNQNLYLLIHTGEDNGSTPISSQPFDLIYYIGADDLTDITT